MRSNRTRKLIAGGVAAVLAFATVMVGASPAMAAPDDAEFTTFTKVVTPPDQSPYGPGDQFSYTITLTCNSPTADICTGANVTDTLPAPLVFDTSVPQAVVVSGGGAPTPTYDGNSFTAAFAQDGTSGTGLATGQQVSITVFVRVPDDATADYNGDITNTATAAATNALPKDATATTTIDVPVVIDSTVAKSVTPGEVQALPGQEVDYSIGGGNASNEAVDEVVVRDPADGTDSPFNEYLDFTGITSITPPTGADQVEIEWIDAAGNEQPAYGPGPIPTDFTGIPDVDPLSDVKGLQFTFSSTTGTIPPGDNGSIDFSAETNDSVLDIPIDGTVPVDNTASSNVVVDDTTSDPKTADGDIVISNTAPTVDVEKSFADPTLLAGDTTTATIESTNGARSVTSMVIQEPTPGQPDLAAQGLDFDGFGTVAWPQNATGASVTYTYADGTTETLDTTTVNTLPDPTGDDVVGFSVTFTGPIQPNSSAQLPFDVTAQPVDGEDDIVSTNDTTSTVTDSTGQTGTDSASADITRQPARVSTVIDKNIVRSDVFDVPGSSTDVTFLASVNDQGDNASTIGADELIVSDPENPQPGDPPSAFWNAFNLSQVSAGVPDNADLTIEYWDGESWQTYAGPISGAAPDQAYPLPDGVSADDIEGIRFVYTPKDGETLPPGFEVSPRISVVTRDQFRDGSGSVHDAAEAADPLVVDNTASSTVTNPDDTSPEDNTATDGDDINVNPFPPDDGVDLVNKAWLQDDVDAFSDDQRTARVSWSTEGLPFDSVAITDDPTAGADYSNIAASTFDAWDLARIEPIDASVDPDMAYDRISTVELYDADANAWVDITAEACGSADTTGTSCDGAFPGYTLTDAERASTVSVRLTYVEGSNRGSGAGPAAGSGVAASYDFERNLDLTFQLRETKRSDGGPVVGSLHDDTYNTGENGVVNNTVEVDGNGAVPVTSEDSDDIEIIDTVINTSVTKSFDQDSLPIPPVDTPQSDYPLVTATLNGVNETEANVSELRVDDPAAIPDAPTPPPADTTTYTYLNLYSIDSITVPQNATSSVVTLTREGGGTTDYTIAEATALTPADLADVTGFSVVHTDPDGVAIASGQSTAISLTYQLREFLRGTTATRPTTADTVNNVASSGASRPGGDPDLDTAYSTADDSLTFADAVYGVTADKTIEPDSRYEDESPDGYTVTIDGQPTGNVRTTRLTLTDDTPTFWNAFQFASFAQETLPAGITQLRVSALTGVDYSVDGDGNLVSTCPTGSIPADCWVVGDWQTADAGGAVTPVLPAGVNAADVRGLRFEIRRDADDSNWESPRTPIITLAFQADRLANLHYGPNGEIDSVPVPSTLPGGEIAPGETVLGTTTDDVDVHGVGSWESPNGVTWTADASADDTTRLLHRVNSISVVKAPGNGSGGADAQQIPPDSDIGYSMTITNTGQWQMTGLELTDEIGADGDGPYVVPVDGADPVFEFSLKDAGGTDLSTDGFSGDLDETTGVVTITVPDGFVFAPGDVLVITAHLQFRDGLAPGTPVGNTITATSDRDFETCAHTSNDRAVADTANVEECAADTTVTPSAAAPISLVKSVKGVAAGTPGADSTDPNYDDLGVLNTAATNPSAANCASPNATNGYYVNECVPITRPGGIEQWQLAFTNKGNVPADAVGGIDVLPAVGDTGVVVGTQRHSEWAPIFIGDFALTATAGTIEGYYMTTVPDVACNAADIEYSTLGEPIPDSDPCYADVSSREWIPYDNSTPAAELATAKALKTVVNYPEGDGLAPGATGTVTFRTQTPTSLPVAYAGEDLPIAWNTVAAGSRATFNGDAIYEGPVEPVRAGVAFPTGEVALQKQVVTPDGWPYPLPDSYDFDLQCTSDGDPVDLVDSDGAPLSPVTVPADGTVVTVGGSGTNLPLFSSCDTAEVASQGANVSYDPAGTDGRSGEMTALDGLSARDDIAHPFASDPDAVTQATVTNEYQLGGFSVSKAVVDGGAVDQDGVPIGYDPAYAFTASCMFLGDEVLNEADRTFTLHDGESKPFDDLPVGADCSVVETDDGGATSTSIVLTEDGTAGDAVDGSDVDFTILPDSDEDNTHVTDVAVTNTYTVGSIAVTKDVTGAGADDWAADDFQVELVCTWDQATTNPVYDETHTITDGETWTVDNLPTGASCTVTEVDDGGATQPTITPAQPVTIGEAGSDTDPVAVTVTNDYRVGGFDVVKTIAGSGTGLSEGVDFTFGYECTYQGDSVGDGELTITGDGTAGPLTSDTVDGLPVGSECTITETDAGDADATPDPVTVTIPDEEDGAAQVATAAFENRVSAGTISVTKLLRGTASSLPEVVDATYTVHVTCSLTADGEPLYDDDVEVTGGQTVTILDDATGEPLLLPVGTHCWGEETDDAGATDSSVNHDSFADAVIVVAGDTDEPQDLDITAVNTFDMGSISIEKDIAGNADHAAGVTFEILVTCTLDRGDGNPPIVVLDQEPVELEGGQLITLYSIPIGSECYAEEPDDHGASDVVISATEDDPVVVGSDQAVTIRVTNDFPDAGFTVTKTVDNGGAENQDGDSIQYSTVFSFSASCVFQGDTVLDEDFQLSDGQTKSYDTLPAGADCVVTETDQGGASTSIVVTQDGTDADLGDASEADFTLLPDDEDGNVVTAVAVTNAYTVGSAEIVKTVSGTGADTWGGELGDFQVRLVCTLDSADPTVVYDETHTMTKEAPGNDWLVENLPTGADCTVTEPDNGGATGDPTITPSTFTVGDDSDGPVQVGIDNSFRTGALNVLKSVSGPGVPQFSNGPFLFSVLCRYEGQTVVQQNLVVVGDGTAGPFTSETITGIPVGSTCLVRETVKADADTTPPPVLVRITDQQVDGVETVVTAGFLNVFSLGTIQVTKDVDGSAADEAYVQDAVFTVQVTCQLEIAGIRVTVFDGPVQVGAGETVQVLNAEGDPLKLPYQTHCFGEETDDGGASASAMDHTGYDDAAVIDVEDEPQLLTLTATNTFDDGSIEVEKTVSGDVSQAAGKTFRIEVTCTLDQGSNDPYVALDREPVMLTAGQSKTIDGLPIGADCWADEPDSGGAAAVSVSATEANPVVVGSDDVVKITVDNTFDPPLASTGLDGSAILMRIAAGGAMVLLGILIVLVAIRRRRRLG